MGINTADRFCAGIFVDHPPSSTSPEFKKEAIRHIAKTQSGPTPFIVRNLRAVNKQVALFTPKQSVTSSLVRALHIAFKNPSISSITVIDLHRASHAAEDSCTPSRVNWVTSLGLK